MSSIFFESATLGQTGDKATLFFSGFFNQKASITNRTFPVDRLIPGRERAFRKTITTVKEFAALGAAFNNFAVAVLLRAADANGFAAAVGI